MRKLLKDEKQRLLTKYVHVLKTEASKDAIKQVAHTAAAR